MDYQRTLEKNIPLSLNVRKLSWDWWACVQQYDKNLSDGKLCVLYYDKHLKAHEIGRQEKNGLF